MRGQPLNQLEIEFQAANTIIEQRSVVAASSEWLWPQPKAMAMMRQNAVQTGIRGQFRTLWRLSTLRSRTTELCDPVRFSINRMSCSTTSCLLPSLVTFLSRQLIYHLANEHPLPSSLQCMLDGTNAFGVHDRNAKAVIIAR